MAFVQFKRENHTPHTEISWRGNWLSTYWSENLSFDFRDQFYLWCLYKNSTLLYNSGWNEIRSDQKNEYREKGERGASPRSSRIPHKRTNEPLHEVIQKCYRNTVNLGILKYITVEFLISMASKKSGNLSKDDYLREIKTLVENKQLEVVKSKLPYLKRTVRLYNPER